MTSVTHDLRWLLPIIVMLSVGDAFGRIPQHAPVPGGVAVLPLGITGPVKPSARFGSRQLLVVPHAEGWAAIVGLPWDILPGNYLVSTVDSESETGKVDLRIAALTSDPNDDSDNSTTVSGKAHRRVGTPVNVPDQIKGAELVNFSMRPDSAQDDSTFTGSVPEFHFGQVVESETLVPFGKLVIDGKVVRHDYLGYFSSIGAQVYAPAPGIIKRIVQNGEGDHLVYLEHGGNVVSLLGNLARILVQEGQQLDSGEQIGTAGEAVDSDRSRVDWGISINGFLVDPLQFTAPP